MKKIGLLLGLISIGLVGTISCSKDENKQEPQPVKNLTIDKNEVGLLVGISEIVSITDGNGGYSVKSSDESKVTASVKANQVIIEAKAEGEATVTITDSKEKSVVIKVNVWESIALESKNVFVKKGATKEVNILSGEGPFSAVSKEKSIAEAIIKDKIITITAVATGTTQIEITDSKTNKTETIEVNVSQLVIAKTTSVLKIGGTEDIAITSGTGGYEILSDKNEIATATIENGVIKISGKSAGTAVVTITDENTEETLQIEVTVKQNEITLSASQLTITENKTKTIEITSGSGEYEVSSSDETIASVTLGNNNVISIKGLKKGNATITLKDKQSNQTKEISVKVVEKFDIGAKRITVIQGDEETTSIIGGEPTIFTSQDPTIATARAAKDEYGDYYIYVLGLKQGSTTIDVSDGDTSYTLRVTVEKAPDLAFVGSASTRNFSVGTHSSAVSITGSGQFTFNNSNESVATVALDASPSYNKIYFLNITAKEAGTTKITITDTLSDQSIELTINVE